MKSMREVNLDTYSLSLLTAKEDILNPRSSTNWALFAYDGVMNRLKLADSGGGLKELTSKLQPRRPLYGMCRVGAAQPRIVMILWVGNEVDEYRRAECASHIPAIRAFFKEVHIFLPAHTLDEITEERICSLVYNAGVGSQGSRMRVGRRLDDRHATVGTNYKRTNAAAEIYRIQRDSFWAQAEREEEERKKEDQRRAVEDRRQRERERLLQEKREAMERERRMNEKEQKIKEQRRIQTQMEAEARKQEKIKWKHEEKEREEEEIRGRYSCSGSGHKAAEAAVLVSQRVENPREFFRQLSSSSLQTASQPKSPHPVRSPYRRLHRSQTDSLFSFAESPLPTQTSPYRAFSYFPSTPTTQSPTVFTKTTAYSLHNGTMVSSENQMQISPPKTMESVAVSDAPRLQTPPSPPPKPEIKSPISAILDSLVFYPPPPVTEELQLDEPEIVDEFPPPPPGFEDSPDSSVDESETPDDPLVSALSTPCASVPEPPSRPLPALPVAPRMLTDLEPERDFSARASVISTVEEEEEEDGEREMKNEGKGVDGKDGERRGWEYGKGGGEEVKEPDGMIMEKYEGEKRSIDEILEKCESEREEAGRILEESESEDGNIVEKCCSEEDQVGKIVEEFESNKEDDGRRFEECKDEEKQDECIMEELKSEQDRAGKTVKEFESRIEEDGNIMEKGGSDEDQVGKTVEESESRIEEDGNMEKGGSEEDQVGKTVEEFESNKDEVWMRFEECKSEGKQDECIMEELKSEKDRAEETVEEFESRIEKDGNNMEKEGSEEDQVGKTVEEFEGNKEEVWRRFEECKGEDKQDERLMEELKSEKDRAEETVEKFQSSREEDGNVFEEFKSERKLDGNIMEKGGSGQDEFGNNVEEFVSDTEEARKMLEECESEEKLDGNIIGKGESVEDEFGKTVEEFESEKIQHENLMIENKEERETREKQEEGGNGLEESENEKNIEQNLEAFDSEKEQDVNNMEASESGKIQLEVCGQENVQFEKEVEKWEEELESEKESEAEKTEVMEDFESGQIPNASITLEYIREREHVPEIMEAFDDEKEQDWKSMEVFEIEDIQYPKMEVCKEDGIIVEKCEEENESEQETYKIMKELETKIEDGSIMEENMNRSVIPEIDEIEQAWKINQAFDSDEKVHDSKNMKGFETETTEYAKNVEEYEQDWMMVEKCEDDRSLDEHEKEQDGKIMEENGREEKQDGKMVDVADGENEQNTTSMITSEIERKQYAKSIEECGQENEQDEKNVENREEEHEREKEKNEEILENVRKKEQNWKMDVMMSHSERTELENDGMESEKIQRVDIEEHKKQKEGFEEVFETEKILYANIMEECRQKNLEIVEKSQEERASEKEQNLKILQTRDDEDDRRSEEQRFESEQTENAEMMLEYITEKDCKTEESHENGKSQEDREGETEQDWKMMEDNEGEKTQDGDIIENPEHDDITKNQYNEGTSSVDADKAENVTVLRTDSYTEIIRKDEETGSVEEAKSHTGNEKEQTEESQHAPSFPESLATETSQYNDSTSNNESNLPTLQVESDSSNLKDLDLSVCPPEAEQGLQTETRITEKTGVETIESSKDLVEGNKTEAKTSSPVSESQARIGQSDEGEGLVPVNQFPEEPDTAVDIKQCIIVTPDLTDAPSYVEEEREATAHITTHTDVEHNSKHSSDPDPENDNKNHEFQQNCKIITETTRGMRNEKKASEK